MKLFEYNLFIDTLDEKIKCYNFNLEANLLKKQQLGSKKLSFSETLTNLGEASLVERSYVCSKKVAH